MITVNFDSEKDTYKTATGLWQWDYGQTLQLQGLDLPAAVEIHFSLQQSGGESEKRIGVTEDGTTMVDIPDKMLENGGKTTDYYIYAFVYLTDENSGKTTYRISMSVKSRPRPERISETTMEALMKAINQIAEGKADGLEYKNNILKLLSGGKELAQVTITGGSGGGADAREIELQKGTTAIQWRYVGDPEWTDLIGLAEITGREGPAGADGLPGQDGAPGADGKSAYQYAQEGGYTGTEEEFAVLVGKQIQKNKEDISQLSEEMSNLGSPTDEQVKNAINEYLDENGVEVGTTAWKGKRLSILGTSISTYPNTIPEGYECYYTVDTMPSVDDMWWKKLCNSLGMELLINNSYSGSCVAKRSGVTIPSGSETVRNMALDDGENAPDAIIVEMGTNDFLVAVSVGSYSVSSGKTFDSYSFKGAYAKMIWNILCKYPNSKVYCATIMPLYQGTDGIPFPTSKSAGGIEAYNDAIKIIADMFGVEVIPLDKCGITTANLINYTVDGRIHPNGNGQTLMANMVVNTMSKFTPVLTAYIDDTVEGDSTDSGDSGGDSGGTGEATLLHSFDFTTGEIVDSVGGLAVTPTNVTADENGALFASNKSEIDVDAAFDARGKTYVLEFGDMDGSALVTTTFYHTYKVFVLGENSFRANYFVWDVDLKQWGWYASSNMAFAFDGEVNDLANGVLKIVVDTDGSASFYFNDVLKYEYPSLITASAYMGIGASDSTYYSMTVKKFEIYSNGE